MAEPIVIPTEYSSKYESERSRVLRRRLLWYCVVALFFIMVSAMMNGLELAGMVESDSEARTFTALDLTGDVFLLSLYAGAMVYVLTRPLSRQRLVQIITWLIVAAGALVILVAPVVETSELAGALTPRRPDQLAWEGSLWALGGVLLLHLLASLLIALSPREGLLILLPLLGFFAIATLFLNEAALTTRLLLILIAPLAGLPGFAWSWWRHKSFNERFQGRMISQRFSEISQDLLDARRMHESLFPPPITRGPVRVDYRYEPMRQIGGDFLFIRPLAIPPIVSEGPLTIVLIDVTGHGVPAALAVNRLHGELERMFTDGATPEPATVISALNTFVGAALAPQGVFATAICLRLDSRELDTGERSAKVTWSNAGHPPALVLRGAGEIMRLSATAPMLGVAAPEVFDATGPAAGSGGDESASFELRQGHAILTFTDGVIEARGEGGEMLGLEAVEKWLADRASETSAPALVGAATGFLDAYRKDAANDDALLVAIAVDGVPGAGAGPERLVQG
ncbi:MAG: serine/threonine-protein phosphatase [Phycisphaerales bacterium]|nr:serine/threonine-protein phosphatase [Phycisphaerales bacterium]